MFSRGGAFRTVIGLFVVVAAGLAVLAAPSAVTGWLQSLNPFAEKSVDRTGPSVLQSLNNISEFHPAYAHYETVVDLESDISKLPSWFTGERVIYVGKGDVDAVVDFGDLGAQSVTLSDDGSSVSVRLPAPRIDRPVLDLENSYVANHDKGFITKFGGSDLERRAQLKAVEQMTAAAGTEGKLVDRAKENTTMMLRGLLGSLGYETITVTFDETPS